MGKFLIDLVTNEDVNSYILKGIVPKGEICEAVKSGDTRLVHEYLCRKANPIERDSYSNTALHLAIVHKNKEMVKLLLEYIRNKEDLDLKTNKGVSIWDELVNEEYTYLLHNLKNKRMIKF